MNKRRTWDYSPVHRTIEIVALLGFAVFWVLLIIQSVGGIIRDEPLRLVWMVPLSWLAAWVLADFFTGVMHFLCDTMGDPDTFYFGPAFIRPFREHHDDPMAICRHDYVERNGDNAIVSLPVLLATYVWGAGESFGGQSFGLFMAIFLACIVLTNDIHAWAHAEKVPRIVRRLQKMRLILSKEHHDFHHTPPHHSHFCITVGWLNGLIDGSGICASIARNAQAPKTKQR